MEGVWWSGSGGGGWWGVPEVGAAVWCSPAKLSCVARFWLTIGPGRSKFEKGVSWGGGTLLEGGSCQLSWHAVGWVVVLTATCPLPLPFSRSLLFS